MHVGLIGCGRWGRQILRELGALGVAVTVVDPGEAAGAAAHEAGAAWVPALGGLGPAEGLIVATPATTHAAVVAEALDRGVPVFTEKPFTLDLPSAEALAARAPERLFVMHVWRHHPAIEAVRDLVAEGALGAPLWLRSTRLNWTSPRTDVDPVWTLLPHDISIAREVLGRCPEPRHAVAEWWEGRPVGLVASLEGPVPVVAEVSARRAGRVRRLVLACEGGVIAFDDARPGIEIARQASGNPLVPCVERREVDPEPALAREIRRIVEHLRGGPPPKSGMADAVAITRCMIEARRLAGIGP